MNKSSDQENLLSNGNTEYIFNIYNIEINCQLFKTIQAFKVCMMGLWSKEQQPNDGNFQENLTEDGKVEPRTLKKPQVEENL